MSVAEFHDWLTTGPLLPHHSSSVPRLFKTNSTLAHYFWLDIIATMLPLLDSIAPTLCYNADGALYIQLVLHHLLCKPP